MPENLNVLVGSEIFPVISNLDPTSPVIEAYRRIRNNIRYISRDNPPKAIVVTSSIDGEGKTSVAANISIVFNSSGMRVIVVDFNLRRSSLHKFFDTPNDRGLTNFIAEGLELEEAIVQTGIEGLSLLPSGPVPPDPSRLVESQKVKDIIRILKEKFDMVIIDTPPAIAVNDPIDVGKFADGILLIIESGKATRSMVENVKDHMKKAGLNLIGVILNKFNLHRAGYSYYNRY